MNLVKLDAKYQKVMRGYWQSFIDRATGKKPFRPNYTVCVPIDPYYAEILDRLEYRAFPESYGDEAWQRKVPKRIRG